MTTIAEMPLPPGHDLSPELSSHRGMCSALLVAASLSEDEARHLRLVAAILDQQPGLASAADLEWLQGLHASIIRGREILWPVGMRSRMAMMRKQGRRKGWARTTNCKTSPAAIERALRIAEACRLRARGLSFPTIARAMGILKNERDKVYALVPAKPSRLREV